LRGSGTLRDEQLFSEDVQAGGRCATSWARVRFFRDPQSRLRNGVSGSTRAALRPPGAPVRVGDTVSSRRPRRKSSRHFLPVAPGFYLGSPCGAFWPEPPVPLQFAAVFPRLRAEGEGRPAAPLTRTAAGARGEPVPPSGACWVPLLRDSTFKAPPMSRRVPKRVSVSDADTRCGPRPAPPAALNAQRGAQSVCYGAKGAHKVSARAPKGRTKCLPGRQRGA
jgi:hypothetical protein